MTTLLQIDSSITGPNSVSRTLTAAIVEKLRQTNSGLHVIQRDLAAAAPAHVTAVNLPSAHPISAAVGNAPEFAADRAASDAILDEFLGADIIVIGAPMYNFSVPSQLKSWIDRLLLPGKTFAYTPEGLQGLAGDKRVIIAISRGNLYGAGQPAASFEHVESYLRSVFAFIGITSPEIILAEGVQLGPDAREAALDKALRQTAELKAA
jgi:FMN-dependent NADH-azoreductase